MLQPDSFKCLMPWQLLQLQKLRDMCFFFGLRQVKRLWNLKIINYPGWNSRLHKPQVGFSIRIGSDLPSFLNLSLVLSNCFSSFQFFSCLFASVREARRWRQCHGVKSRKAGCHWVPYLLNGPDLFLQLVLRIEMQLFFIYTFIFEIMELVRSEWWVRTVACL